jgi:hypothetical protein
MSGDTSPKIPTNLMDESGKSNSLEGKPEDNKFSTSSGSKGKKKNNSHKKEEKDKLETTDDEIYYLEWKA